MICCARVDCEQPATHFREGTGYRVCASHYWPEVGEFLLPNQSGNWGDTVGEQLASPEFPAEARDPAVAEASGPFSANADDLVGPEIEETDDTEVVAVPPDTGDAPQRGKKPLAD